jgi:hypothetical protein
MSKKKKKKSKPKMMNPNEQREHMISRYGTHCLWVDVTLHLTHQEMFDYFGPECDEYEPLCTCCTEWKRWHKTGTATIMFERDELVKLK